MRPSAMWTSSIARGSAQAKPIRPTSFAAEGGTVSLYTSISGSVVEDIVGAFEDEYDIDVALYRAANEIVEQRLLEEADAGFDGADVVDTAGQTLLVLREREARIGVEASAWTQHSEKPLAG